MSMLETTSEEFQEEICRKFNTSKKQVLQDLVVLKEWISKQPHLPQCSSNGLLISILLSSKTSMERAKQRIDNYYTIKLEIPDFFANRDPEGERDRKIAEEMLMYMLPKYTSDGCAVACAGFVTGDASKFDVTACGKLTMMIAEVVYTFAPYMMGVYIVVDCSKFSSAHLIRITPTIVRDFINCMQYFMPLVFKGIIAFNCSSLIDVVVGLGKPFVKGKYIERVHLHSEGSEILEKYFPKDMLPNDYGGKAGSKITLTEITRRALLEKRKWLMNEGSATVDETKRVKDVRDKKCLGLLGKQGTFKSLNID